MRKANLQASKNEKVRRPTNSRFFELASRLTEATDPKERRQLKKELARMTFGD
jgi:hypothetical protein